jgi:hypothetical protein
MSTSSPVLRSSNLGWAGRMASQASIASPTVRSTGLVNAVPVLLIGTSSRHTDRASPSSLVLCCQRTAPTRSRSSSSVRRPENSHSSATALTSSSGYHGVPVPPRLACNGRSALVRFRPAHISFAHTSSEITRGSGPINALIERGSANARRASKRRSIQSHSWMSPKNVRSDQISCAFARGLIGPPYRARM